MLLPNVIPSKESTTLELNCLTNGFWGKHSNPGLHPCLLICSPFRAKESEGKEFEKLESAHIKPILMSNRQLGTWNLELETLPIQPHFKLMNAFPGNDNVGIVEF